MPAVEDSAHLASDAELITSVRAGDRQAFGDLYSRHASAAATLARQFARSPTEADDLVSEAFARVLDGLLEGKGPDTAFRAYLFTTVRNTAYDRTRKDKRLQFTDDIESHDQAVELDDPVIADLENGLVGRAFAGLPERWQTVLWHVQVEGQSPAEVGVLMGMAPNAVSSLAFRAREGLREAYLQAHLAETAAQHCRTTVDRLGAWTRGGLSKRERAQVDAHLQVCDRCPALAAELSEINTSLRGLLAPLLLGGAAAGYVATLGPIAPLVQLGTFTGGATVMGSSKVAGAAHGSTTGAKTLAGKVFGGKGALALAKVGPWAPGAALAGAAAATAGVIAAVVLSLAGGSTTPVVAGSQAPLPVAGSNVGGGSTANGGGAGGGAAGGGSSSGALAPGLPVSTGTVSTGTVSITASGRPSTGSAAGVGPTTVPPGTGPTAPGVGNGSTGPGGATIGIPITIGPDPGSLGGSGGPGVTGTDIGGPPSTDGQGLPGQPANPSSTPGGTPGSADTSTPSLPGSGSSTTAPPDPATSTTAPSTTAPSNPAGSDPGGSTTGGSTTAGPTTTVPTTTVPTSDSVPTTPTAPTAPTTPIAPTIPTAPTTPPAPALLSVSASVASDAVAGSDVTVSVTVANTGGSASAAGQSVNITVPDGLSIGSVVLGSPLRTPHAFAAAAAPACTQAGLDVFCALPPIAPQANFVLSVSLDVSPDVADGDITVMLNGVVSDVHTIPLTVQSGYAAVRLSRAGGLPLAPAAVNSVALIALPKPGVRTPGRLTLASPDFAVVGVHGDGGGCTVTAGAVSCLAPAIQAGVTVDLAVDASATAPPVVTATDQRGRAVAGSTDLTVDRSGIGGYRSVRISGPGHLLRAGSVDTVTMAATTLNSGVVNAGPITLPVQLSAGVRIADRPGSALPAGCVATADTVTCSPADGAAAEFALPVQVSAAAVGTQQLAQASVPAGVVRLDDGAGPLTVDPASSGYDRISLTASTPLAAGSMASLTLDAVVGEGVTEPGPVRIARQLAPGLLVTAATGCDRIGDEFSCPPAVDGNPAPVLTVAVLPLAGTGTDVVPAGLEGGRAQGIVGAFAVVPRAPGQRISLTGPFGGRTVGAATLRCDTAGILVRNTCPGGLTTVTSSSATLTVPAGATVISAELTWAATAPAFGAASTLDTIDVCIDGHRPVSVHGVRPAGVAADVTGPNPVTSGQSFQRVASADAQQLLAAGAASGTHTVTVRHLAARTVAAGTSPMGAWSLTVLWSTGTAANVGVITDNRGQYSSSTKAGAVTTIEPAGKPVTSVFQTIWAPDPWARKTLSIGDTPIAGDVNGLHGNLLDGFELLHPALPEGGLVGPLTFTNRLTPPAGVSADGLWIGPMLLFTTP